MANQPLLRFGVEIEMILKPKQPYARLNERELSECISETHNAKGLTRMHSRMPGTRVEEVDNEEWELKTDSSLHADPEDRYTCLTREMTSPILNFDGTKEWQAEIESAFASVRVYADTKTNSTCATHIHISLGDGSDWSLAELKEICMAVTWFEGAILALLPPNRRKNGYCQSHTAERDWSRMRADSYWDHIERNCTNCDKVVALMNPEPLLHLTRSNDYAWNFENILPPRIYGIYSTGKTIEWHQPPGVTTAEECQAWAHFALVFIQLARSPGTHEDIRTHVRNVGDLKEFMERGCAIGTGQPLDRIFDGVPDAADEIPVLPWDFLGE